jgi:hypothetical protein
MFAINTEVKHETSYKFGILRDEIIWDAHTAQ